MPQETAPTQCCTSVEGMMATGMLAEEKGVWWWGGLHAATRQEGVLSRGWEGEPHDCNWNISSDTLRGQATAWRTWLCWTPSGRNDRAWMFQCESLTRQRTHARTHTRPSLSSAPSASWRAGVEQAPMCTFHSTLEDDIIVDPSEKLPIQGGGCWFREGLPSQTRTRTPCQKQVEGGCSTATF